MPKGEKDSKEKKKKKVTTEPKKQKKKRVTTEPKKQKEKKGNRPGRGEASATYNSTKTRVWYVIKTEGSTDEIAQRKADKLCGKTYNAIQDLESPHQKGKSKSSKKTRDVPV